MPKKDAANIFLISGNDANLLSQRVREVVAKCIGDQSPEIVLTRLEEADYDQEDNFNISPLMEAVESPPMYEPFRVVEARNLGHFSTQNDLEPLLNYLNNPLDTTKLVLVWEKGQKQSRLAPLNKKLKDAVTAAGGTVISASKPRGFQDTQNWFQEQIRSSGLPFNKEAQDLIKNHLGEELGRLKSLLEVLNSALGGQNQIGAKEVEPFLGSKGSVPAWDLTNLLSKGDGTQSLQCLKRKLDAGENHIAILYFLINHYLRISLLDGAGYSNSDQAAKDLGISAYPAKLALQESQKLGTQKIQRIIKLLAKADKDMKGGSGLEPEVILEILIARIAQQYRLKQAA